MRKLPVIIEACYYGDEALLLECLQNGESIHKKYRKNTPVRWAVQEGHTKIVKILIENGANAHQLDTEGFTLLYTATAGGHKSIVKYLLKCGVDVNQIGDGATALQIAACYGEFEIFKILIAAGADIKIKDDEGRTARYYAKRYKRQEILDHIDSLK